LWFKVGKIVSISIGKKMVIESIGVIGAGIMGNGITQVLAASGLQVVMIDINQAAIDKGMQSISSSFDRLVKKEKMTADDKAAAIARIIPSLDYTDLKGLHLVIEAATENKPIKEKILKQIDEVCDAHTIIASNTSSLSVTQLASNISNPSRVIGMHFFNPVPLMSLVEIIRGLQTGDATHQSIHDLAVRLGKTPITVKNAPGFVVNRILVPMINEAFFVLGEGLASAEDIDNGMKLGCNQPIGPLALADLIGLDTCLAIMEVYFNNFNDSKYRPCPLLREMVDAGYLGRKTGRGVYQY
jgi:3-hydroxybutyryl-CoA dehydrogenase